MSNSNPILRAVLNSRATVDEKLEAYKYIRDEDESVQGFLHGANESKLPQIMHHTAVSEEADELVLTGDQIRGLATGYRDWDKMTRGMNPAEVVVLFATPGVGKSLVAQNITTVAAEHGNPVLFIGVEMSAPENEARFKQMYAGKLDELDRLPIYYPQSKDIKAEDIDGLVEAAKEQQGIKLVVVDHLHMWKTTGASRSESEAIANAVKEMKRVTRKHEVPMLLLAQCNRNVTGIPLLTDLLGSSAIEQIADIAITLWKDPEGDQATTPLKVKLRKQRKGWRLDEFYLYPVGNGRLAEEGYMSDLPGR